MKEISVLLTTKSDNRHHPTKEPSYREVSINSFKDPTKKEGKFVVIVALEACFYQIVFKKVKIFCTDTSPPHAHESLIAHANQHQFLLKYRTWIYVTQSLAS